MNQDREHGFYVQTQMEFYDRIVVVVVGFFFLMKLFFIFSSSWINDLQT